MKIKVGNFDILSSGTVIGNEDEPVDFFLNEASGFIARFRFINNLEQDKASIFAEKFGKIGFQITFTNYNSSLGTGNTKPIKIGHFTNRELYINYRIYSFAKGGKLVHYTWLLGKEVKNG